MHRIQCLRHFWHFGCGAASDARSKRDAVTGDVSPRMKTLLITMIAAPVLLIALLGIGGILPGGDGVVTNATLADGTVVQVVQQYGTGDVGYEVGFYFKPPKGEWGWCYLDHEDTQWRNGRIEFDAVTDTVSVWKGGTLRGRWNRQSAQWERPDVSGWVSDAPQKLRAPPFEVNKG